MPITKPVKLEAPSNQPSPVTNVQALTPDIVDSTETRSNDDNQQSNIELEPTIEEQPTNLRRSARVRKQTEFI